MALSCKIFTAAFALAACIPSAGEARDQHYAVNKAAFDGLESNRQSLSVSPVFNPRKGEADSCLVLTYADGVAHRAWISGDLFLNIVDPSIRTQIDPAVG